MSDAQRFEPPAASGVVLEDTRGMHCNLGKSRFAPFQIAALAALIAAISLSAPVVVAADVAPTGEATQATYNSPPWIWGRPAHTARRGKFYTFTPKAGDPNGDPLAFSVVNKPRWMWFNRRTGQLSGIPRWAQRNRTFSNIVIKVSDGKVIRALPAFSITVRRPTRPGNAAPLISGNPRNEARVGQQYFFKPSASDRNGDVLTFQVVAKPSWASFAPKTGALYGIPGPEDVGPYPSVTIRVSDGKVTRQLAPFSINVTQAMTASVTLNWSAPTRNTDGTPLADLAGYKVFYGPGPRQYSTALPITNAGTTSAVIDGLASGTWYFAIKSVNSAGVESDYSGEVKAVL